MAADGAGTGPGRAAAPREAAGPRLGREPSGEGAGRLLLGDSGGCGSAAPRQAAAGRAGTRTAGGPPRAAVEVPAETWCLGGAARNRAGGAGSPRGPSHRTGEVGSRRFRDRSNAKSRRFGKPSQPF